MNVSSLNSLLSLLKERMERFSNRKAIDPETHLAVTLIFLAQGCNFHVISWAYKLGISTVRKIIYETCHAIWDELQVVYLSPPNVSELKAIANKFYVKTGMPSCLGAIDGKHIRIASPRNRGSLYYS
ncbi:protein ANTAGONIST OF LIKE HETEROCHROMATIN PROTEIN 1-like [Rhagoletis pomonella]|uniref:protein ANTAGONIST OF LIKE HETEROCHROMATIN PROTEIN 1-like n=1 Tax=Rhagoletis pomonella TaxID=28610 RepID=UPI001786C53D|nr:protein ANTAGONIST OF LIKE HETEROCHROMATIN PROTEIN 1-like [Rhagoletis pomonella]